MTQRQASEYSLNNEAAAQRIGIKPSTLRKWRCTGEKQIPYIKPAGRPMYHPADIDEFKISTLRTHTA